MKQEKRITYRAGITRTPSDFLCQDGELAECINLTTDDEELKPMVKPVGLMQASGRTLLYVHRHNDEVRYIFQSGNTLYWREGESGADVQLPGAFDFSKVNTVTSVGKTLIVTDGGGMHYYLWKGLSGDTLVDYLNLGALPDIRVEFSLRGNDLERTVDMEPGVFMDSIASSGPTHGILDVQDGKASIAYNKEKWSEFNDLMIGLYSKNKKDIAHMKGFCQPFFVRTAYKLFDGSYTHISNPILMLPCVTTNSYARYYHEEDVNKLTVITHFRNMWVDMADDLSLFSDIIDDVVVFASDGIDPYDLYGDLPIYTFTQADEGVKTIHDGVYQINSHSNPTYRSLYHATKLEPGHADYQGTESAIFLTIDALPKKKAEDYLMELESTSVFYKLCELGLKPFHGNIAAKIQPGVMENLTTQQQLKEDDYFSRNRLYPQFTYSYNSRLNLANVSRGFFEGYDFFMPWDWSNSDETHVYDFYVTLRLEGGIKVIHHRSQPTKQKQGVFFFYPDSRATHVVIIRDKDSGGGTCVCDSDLKESAGLNGAYCLRGMPGTQITDEDSVTPMPAIPETNNGDVETLPNYVITSEVNNPWVYKAEGYYKVSTGKILGISSITQALSQGQFGEYPLLVFSETGIWAMSVDGTGLYQAIHPMSREVCINACSITQTDGAVFFVSKKGLMVIVGNEVKCVSERMNGRGFDTAGLVALTGPAAPWADIITACQGTETFQQYVCDEQCRMAYDYVDSRLLIFNPQYGFAFVYAMADGAISKVVLPYTVTNVVNAYPDYLLQDTAGTAYTLYGKQREEEVADRQTAFLLTRPMKLAGPTGVTSLRELVNVGTWDKGTRENPLSTVKTEAWVSDDMQEWNPLASRFGAAAKYFRLALYIRMLPSERLSGTIITEQERRTNNIRHE